MLKIPTALCAMALCLLWSCSGKKRDFADGVVLPNQPGGADAAVPARVAGALGSACSAASDCTAGNCVDGVCCRTPCDAVCARCDAPGSEGECTATSSDDACSAACPDSTECRSYGLGPSGTNCEAPGLCRANVQCTPSDSPAGTPCRDGTGACDGSGECVVPGARRLGQACTTDTECGEGHCVVGATGVGSCCDSACTGLCRSCDAAGRCVQPSSTDARCGAVDCPADDACRDYPDDISASSCRGFGTCRTSADCTPRELRPAAECACGENGCVLALGALCETNEQCASGTCEGTAAGTRVCCATGCAASGSACASSGSGCVACEGNSAECVGSISRVCTNDVVDEQPCGNGCDAQTGLCAELRATGSVCDVAEQCASATCSLDVTGTTRCCDVSCAASGRVCGTDGTCVCSAEQQDVAGSCLAKNGVTCTTNADCASGACIQTVAGASICCAIACPGASCSADGSSCVQCEGAGAECVGNTSRRCENSQFVDSDCGNGCDPATGVCSGLLANGQACTGSAQCASNSCEPDLGGLQRCCTPNCAATGRVCGADGACVCPDPNDTFLAGQCRSPAGQACTAGTDCSTGACEGTQSGGLVCCTGPCNGQICRASGQGCVQCEGAPPSCQGASSRTCVNNAFVVTNCANGCNPATGMCNSQIALGGTGCSQDPQCAGAGSSCQGGRCCEFDCAAAGRVCANNGTCGCPGGTTPVGGACLFAIGQNCTSNEQCASGSCQRWFLDGDVDLHGSPDLSLSIQICTQLGSAPPTGYVASNDDCCDEDAQANPDQTGRFAVANACDDFDYNCDGDILNTFEADTLRFGITPCNEIALEDCNVNRWSSGTVPQCGAMASFQACGQVVTTSSAGRTASCVAVTGGTLQNTCN